MSGENNSGEVQLEFKNCKNDEEVRQLFNFNTGAFSSMADITWSFEELKAELKRGWILYAALEEKSENIVAALLVKVDGGVLLTKNTPIKMDFQGNGYSHKIKNFYEKLAQEKKIHKIAHYCKSDDFRMISLNGTHGYVQTGQKIGEGNDILEWMKTF